MDWFLYDRDLRHERDKLMRHPLMRKVVDGGVFLMYRRKKNADSQSLKRLKTSYAVGFIYHSIKR